VNGSNVPPSGLIITADDFGAATQVNAAVELAHREGVLGAASLMVGGEAATDAVERSRRLPCLRVGLHLVLVDGRPVLRPDEIPDLVGPEGWFRHDMVGAGFRFFFDPRARRQLAAEITAQFDAFAATGLNLDHVNAHKHFHLHPTIAGLILEIGKPRGMRAVRIPVEPGRALRRIEPGRGGGYQPVVDLWAALARRRFQRAGMLVPDQVFGLRWSGAITAERLLGIVRNLPPGLSEIYLHPATEGGFAGAAPGYRYAEELAALTDPRVRQAASGFPRGGFSDFAERRTGTA
jgi:hopanoid biosynthesis associated protein HpnK